MFFPTMLTLPTLRLLQAQWKHLKELAERINQFQSLQSKYEPVPYLSICSGKIKNVQKYKSHLFIKYKLQGRLNCAAQGWRGDTGDHYADEGFPLMTILYTNHPYLHIVNMPISTNIYSAFYNSSFKSFQANQWLIPLIVFCQNLI